MSQSNTTKIDRQTNTGNTGKYVNISMDKIREALNEALPEIEDTAPNMEQKAGVR